MNKLILFLIIILFSCNPSVALTDTTGFNGYNWSENSTSIGWIEDVGDSYMKGGLFSDSCEDANLSRWTGSYVAYDLESKNGVYSINASNASSWVQNFESTNIAYSSDTVYTSFAWVKFNSAISYIKFVNGTGTFHAEGANAKHDSETVIKTYDGSLVTVYSGINTSNWYLVKTISNTSSNTYDVYLYDENYTELGNVTGRDNSNSFPSKLKLTLTTGGSINADDIRIFNTTTGNLTRNIFDSGDGNKISNIRVTGIIPVDSSIVISVNKSTDNSNFVWEELNTYSTVGEFDINYDVTGDYRYGGWDIYRNDGDFNTSTVYNVTIEYAATNVSAPNITSFTTPTTFSSYENVLTMFNATADQIVNFSWLINGTEVQTNLSVLSASYFNLTALNGTYNITTIVTNVNGTDQQSWIWTLLLNSFDMYIINETQTVVWFETSNYTTGLDGFNFTLGNRIIGDTNNISTLYYQNGTSITSNSTYVNGNVTLIPGFLIPEGTYYIEETATTTIETFVVTAGAFAAVVVAGAVVVSRRVRRGISGFWNRRIRRR